MNVASTIARYLLGLLFTIFGANGFLHFIPLPPAPATAMQWQTLMNDTHYMVFVFACEIVAGVLLLAGRYVPLALAILAALIANILAFHLAMNVGGIGIAVFAAILWAIVFSRYRAAFAGLFEAGPGPART